MLILDLCAGTGSATQAFVDRGHDVETLDIIGDHTYIVDVREFHPTKNYDFIWASPECKEFSLLKRTSCKDRTPDMSIVYACLDICKTAPYWILENPRACLRYFIGMPTTTVYYSDYGDDVAKPTDLWGVFPFFYSTSIRKEIVPWKKARGTKNQNRSKIPYGLSSAICKALEREYETT